MSLHVEISQEAQQEYERMQKRSMFSSIVVSILSFTLLGILFVALKIIIADPQREPVKGIIIESSPIPPSPEPEVMQDTTQTTPSTNIINSKLEGAISIPSPDFPVQVPGDTFTQQPGFDIVPGIPGDNPGIDLGPPGGPILTQRCSQEDRLRLIKQSGGTPKFDDSVVKALRWLAKKQNNDGSWGAGTQKTGLTGMALLTYLARCETPHSEEFGESCMSAITYLIGEGKKQNGFLSTTPTDKYVSYHHAVATYALAEASTFCKSMNIPVEGLQETVQQAANIIIKSQSSDGSWMYYYKTREEGGSYPDLSISGWNIQALKAVKHSPVTGVDSERALRRAEIFVKKMCDPKRTGKYQYRAGDFRPSMTPVGVLCLQMMESSHFREAKEGIKFMEENIKPEFNDPYTYYYAAQVFINRGGKAWDNFGKKMGEIITEKQQPDGSWPNGSAALVNSHMAGAETDIYRTCLNALTLEVYYRFLPATGEGTRNTSTLRTE